MDIPSALIVLRDAPLESFRHHISDAVSTLQEVLRRLKDLAQHGESEAMIIPACRRCQQAVSSTPSTSPMPYTSANSDRRHTNSHSRNNTSIRRSDPTPRTPIRRPLKPQSKKDSNSNNPRREASAQGRPVILFEALINELRSVYDLVQGRKPEVVYQTQQGYWHDRRLNDVLRLDGIQDPTAVDKLFRGVAQRSLAMQYSEYQHNSRQNSRVEDICHCLSSHHPETRDKLHQRRGGGIASWVRQHLPYEVEKAKAAQECVSSGIKQLVVERLLEERLQRAGRAKKASGISALTALTITPFKDLRLNEIPSFLDHLLQESSGVNLPAAAPEQSDMTSHDLLDIIGNISEWFEVFQNTYDKGNSGCIATGQEPQQSSSRHPHYSPPGPDEALSRRPGDGDMECQREQSLEREQASTGQQSSSERPESTQERFNGAAFCTRALPANICPASSDMTGQEFQVSWRPTCEGQKRQRTGDVQLLSNRLLPDSDPVLPMTSPEGHDEPSNGHTAQSVGNRTSESNNIIQQSFHADNDTTMETHPPSRCIDQLPASRSRGVSGAPDIDHQLHLTQQGPTHREQNAHGRLGDHETSALSDGEAAANADLESRDISIIRQNQQFSNMSESNVEPVDVFNPLNYPNLLSAQAVPDPQFPYVFNPLDYPNLIADTQRSQDPQLSIVFNPLDYPSLIADTQPSQDPQLPHVFNPLDYPNLIADIQAPQDPNVFNPLDYPNLIADTQHPQDPQVPNVFNPSDHPSMPPDARSYTVRAEAEYVGSGIPPTILSAC